MAKQKTKSKKRKTARKAKAKAKHAGGRPTKYKVEMCDQVYKLCLLGYIDKEIAAFYAIRESTVNKWKVEHPKFMESIKRGKDLADANVAESLYKRALGYTHPEEKVFCNLGHVITHETTKHYPPDTQAASLFLRNRQPNKWRDKQEIDHTTKGEKITQPSITFAGSTPAQPTSPETR